MLRTKGSGTNLPNASKQLVKFSTPLCTVDTSEMHDRDPMKALRICSRSSSESIWLICSTTWERRLTGCHTR